MTEQSALMGVAQAIHARHATRAFTDRPVSRAVLSELLSDALRAPSGGNIQPWHIYVLMADGLERLKADVGAKVRAGAPEEFSHEIYPENLWAPYRDRRFANGEALYRTIGIDRDDQTGRTNHLRKNFNLFGAPVGLFFAIDKRMGQGQWLDLGMLMQNVMLLAVEKGLATCPQAAWVRWSDTVRHHLNLDASLTVAAGMALGYADTANPVNTFRSAREPLDSAVTFADQA